MKYNELQVAKRKKIRRSGRGIAAGRGKTAGRGTKGQNARSGNSAGRNSYGGRKDSMIKRMAKLPGFTSHRKPAQQVYTGQLDAIKAKTIDNHILAEAGIIKDPYHTSKLIVKGEVTKPKELKIQFASATAIEKLQKAGGSFTKVDRPQRQALVGTEKDTKRQAKDNEPKASKKKID